MKRSFGLWQLAGYAASTLLGTFLHFLYDLTGGAVWTAPLSGVNESTWEHMKLLFWPLFLFAIVQRFFFAEQENFWCIKRNGILLGLVLIPVLFYTYNGVIGPSPDWVNIAIFFLAAAGAFLYEAWKWRDGTVKCPSQTAAILMLCAVGVMFVLFTFWTPKLGIFRDPLTQLYGLNAAKP